MKGLSLGTIVVVCFVVGTKHIANVEHSKLLQPFAQLCQIVRCPQGPCVHIAFPCLLKERICAPCQCS